MPLRWTPRAFLHVPHICHHVRAVSVDATEGKRLRSIKKMSKQEDTTRGDMHRIRAKSHDRPNACGLRRPGRRRANAGAHLRRGAAVPQPCAPCSGRKKINTSLSDVLNSMIMQGSIRPTLSLCRLVHVSLRSPWRGGHHKSPRCVVSLAVASAISFGAADRLPSRVSAAVPGLSRERRRLSAAAGVRDAVCRASLQPDTSVASLAATAVVSCVDAPSAGVGERAS